MKKSVRINLLVITIVVTLFVFAGLWYLRPGVSDEIIQQARIRQSQPLMEIAEPLRKPKAEDLIDTTQLVKELQRDLEPSIKAAVKADLLSDPAFARVEEPKIDVAALQAELQSAIKADLLADPTFATAVTQQVDVVALRSQIQPAIRRAILADLPGDPAFTSLVNREVDAIAIRSQIQPAIKRGVLADLRTDSAFIRSISSQIDFSSVTLANEQALVAVSDANDRAIASLRREINAQIAALPTVPTTLRVDDSEMDRIVDQTYDRVFSSLQGEIESLAQPPTALRVDDAEMDRIVGQTHDRVFASLESEIDARIDARPAMPVIAGVDEQQVHRILAEAVDAQIPIVVDAVVARIEANRDQYIEAVRSSLGDVVTEDEVVDLYLSYRSAMVQDLVPAILDDVEALLKGESAPSEMAIVPAAPKPREETPAVVVTPPAVPAAPTPAVVEPVAPKAPPAPVAQVQQVPEPPKSVPVVTSEPTPEAPAAPTMVTKSAEEAEYEVERQRLRTEAINEVLRRIGQ